MFHKILVANRGEIALRVIRACRDLGVPVAVVYSEADRGAPYLELADQAVCIGPAVASESYLKPGYFADVVVFDPKTYRDTATYDQPHRYAAGVSGTVVQVVAKNEEFVDFGAVLFLVEPS